MEDDVSQRLKFVLLKFTPLIFSLFLVFLSFVPLDFSITNNVKPAVGMVCVYYWMIHRPDLFNMFSVFVLGMVEDFISSAPMGVNTFSLLFLYVILNALLKFFNGKPFIVTWYGFAFVAFLTIFVKWLAISIYYADFLPVVKVFVAYLITVAAYPILSLANAFVQDFLIKDEI